MNEAVIPKYPFEAFHLDVLRAMNEVHQRVKAPDALVGMAFLTTMSVACQGLIDVRLPNGMVRPVSLNILVLAESGERKSGVDSLVSAPIHTFDERSIQEYDAANARYAAELVVWRAKQARILKKIMRVKEDE